MKLWLALFGLLWTCIIILISRDTLQSSVSTVTSFIVHIRQNHSLVWDTYEWKNKADLVSAYCLYSVEGVARTLSVLCIIALSFAALNFSTIPFNLWDVEMTGNIMALDQIRCQILHHLMSFVTIVTKNWLFTSVQRIRWKDLTWLTNAYWVFSFDNLFEMLSVPSSIPFLQNIRLRAWQLNHW